ncbi:hypothetical protein RCL1_000714 [Eukaryota sp. TZLM3-RCL]
MQLKFRQTLVPASGSITHISGISWSPDNRRLAVAYNNVVHLFDENLEWRDKFSTRPGGDKTNSKSYVIRDICFSPDSSRIAIAQSDNSLFVYKIGTDWEDRKSICNKFLPSSSVTCIAWPSTAQQILLFGTADGAIRLASLKGNKDIQIYKHDFPALSLAFSSDGLVLLSSHSDGSLHRFTFDSGHKSAAHVLFPRSTSIPLSICSGEGQSWIVLDDQRNVTVLSNSGTVNQILSPSPEFTRQLTCLELSPSKQSLLIGGFDCFFVYSFNERRGLWSLKNTIQLPNIKSVSALKWRPDSSKVAICSSRGIVDVYDACLRRLMLSNGAFELTFVSPTIVIVKICSSGERLKLMTTFGSEITSVKVFKDRFLVGKTSESRLLADVVTKSSSEIAWNSSQNLNSNIGGTGQNSEENERLLSEKYMFEEDSGIAMIYQSGELFFVELGQNDVILTVRTEKVNQHVLSTAILISSRNRVTITTRRIVYLTDSYTISIVDIDSSDTPGITPPTPLTSFTHTDVIDWLELNSFGDKLLFRDRSGCLFLVNLTLEDHDVYISEVTKKPLLSTCQYVQWVPKSDVIVAQSDCKLCVWYDPDYTDRLTTIDIVGELVDIERNNGKTEVVVEEGVSQAVYVLDEALIRFGTALRHDNLRAALACLEDLVVDPQIESLWTRLLNESIKSQDLSLAIRCATAIADVSKGHYLQEVMEIQESGGSDAEIRAMARLHLLNNDILSAKNVLLQSGLIDDAIDLFSSVGLINIAYSIAQSNHHPSTQSIKEELIRFYLDSGQEVAAADLHVDNGDYVTAINLYLKGKQPKLAAQLVLDHNLFYQSQIIELITSSLIEVKQSQVAGKLLESAEQFSDALKCYVTGHNYDEAIRLAKTRFPASVGELYSKFGVYLLENHQPRIATSHFLEAKQTILASYAELKAGNLEKSLEYLEKSTRSSIPIPSSLSFITPSYLYVSIAEKFEQQGQLGRADTLYSKAGFPERAVEMYTRLSLWEEAHRSALNYMKEEDVRKLYVDHANNLARNGKSKEAEKLFLTVNQPDLAINMYKVAKDYESMIRLIKAYRKEHLEQTLKFLAQNLESEGNLKQAESFYLQTRDWNSAVKMYIYAKNFEKALGLAKLYGGNTATKSVAYQWAEEKGSHQGVELLIKLGLIELSIEFAIDHDLVEIALEKATSLLPNAIPEVYSKLARNFVDKGQVLKAEEYYIKANKIKDAVDLYVNSGDWVSAMRVAENNQSKLIDYVRQCQSKVSIHSSYSARRNTTPDSSLIYRPNLIEDQTDDVIGHISSSKFNQIDSLIGQNDWKRAQIVAESQGPDATAYFSHHYAKYLHENSATLQCLDILSKYSIEISESSVDFIKKLVISVLSAPFTSPLNQLSPLTTLRQIVFSIWRSCTNTPALSHLKSTVESALWMIHLYSKALEAKSLGLLSISASLLCSLLRFNGILPSDKLFYEAGSACLAVKETNAAWIFLDKFIDIVEAVEGGEDYVESSDLIDTDIPITNIKLPSTLYVPTNLAEEKRQWVLSMSMADEVSSEPNCRPCPDCGESIYDLRMSCNFCETRFDPCIASGVPLSSTSEVVTCGDCGMKASGRKLREWVGKTRKCPWCNSLA